MHSTRLFGYLEKASSAVSGRTSIKGVKKQVFNPHNLHLKAEIAAGLLVAPAAYGLYTLADKLLTHKYKQKK
jgi:hypothetical protein